MSGLSIQNISMRFDLPNGGSVQALKDVTLDLKAGELLSVLGPSGCGKTTLLNIIAGFLAPTNGEILLHGNKVTGPSAERGMVFQQGALFEWMNVRENVGFGPRMKGVDTAQARKRVDQLLDIVGLQDFKEKAIYELSRILVKKFKGRVPESFEELEKLPGVGHKTASVVMSQGFGHPAFPVDTHIHRLAQRWGLTNGKNVVQTEKDLKFLFPKKSWNKLHLQIIFYGREYCQARYCYGLECEICKSCNPKRSKPIKTKKP